MTVGPPRRIVFVGASAAGLSAAEAPRREGFDGALAPVGREHHLPCDRPPPSSQILSRTWSAERTALRPSPAWRPPEPARWHRTTEPPAATTA
ncbi:hypothetical protein [Streptomyces sp. NPDC092952]|uniref:hypothetical protein n=1 Tax=Streptomyces sp. NPDC092952 TaxID=3366018 RepID=UPI0037F20DF6